MLRVSYSESSGGQRWSLCGRLAGPWVEELRACWRQGRERAPLARAVVDLKDVVFIDEGGERLLAEMQAAGAELIAAGVDHQHLLENLKTGEERALRRGVENIGASCARALRETDK